MTLIQILESREEALNVQQVADLFGVSKRHIYELVADGRLPAFRVGKAIRFDPQDVADWLRKKKPATEQPIRRTLKSPQSTRKGQESIASFHGWRGRVRSLETALAMNSSDDNRVKTP